LVLAFSAVLASACCFDSSLMKDEFRVNPAARLWKAGSDKRPYVPRMLGSKPPSTKPSAMAIGAGNEDLPKNFDAREKWSYCKDSISNVRNQAHCESCWAVSSAAAISDLTCIKCNGTVSPYLSDEDIISCCHECSDTQDCVNGGEPSKAFNYWKTNGVVTGGHYDVTDGCSPYPVLPYLRYPADKFPPMPVCDNLCVNNLFNGNYMDDKHRGETFGSISGEVNMQNALYQYGPIVASFMVYEDFQKHYDNGIYHLTQGSEFKGWHAVKVIGWGEENGNKYWLVVNSWGTGWGMNGFFKILRGTNECEIEGNVVYGSASSSSCFAHAQVDPSSTSTTTTSTSTSTTTTAAGSSSSSTKKTSAGNMCQFQFSILSICTVLILSWNFLFKK